MRAARVIAIVALLFLAFSSCVGGIPLIADPSGGILKMPVTFLEHSPFHSFLIPGLILLFANGILGFAITIAVIRKLKGHALWVVFQGCVLFGWITIEVLMLRVVIWAHFVYWVLAIVLIAAGLGIRRGEEQMCREARMPSPRALLLAQSSPSSAFSNSSASVMGGRQVRPRQTMV
jgi:hypothetical protein